MLGQRFNLRGLLDGRRSSDHAVQKTAQLFLAVLYLQNADAQSDGVS